MRYRLAKLVGWFALAVAVLGQAHPDERDFTKPNIVILLADDLGYGELGCQGNSEIPTPHIDSIAANGVRFTNGYVTAPFCSASIAASWLMTLAHSMEYWWMRIIASINSAGPQA